MAESECGMYIKQISDHIASNGNRQLAGQDLTLTQLRYLEYIASFPDGITSRQLEEYFQAAQPTVFGVIRRLNKKGLVDLTSAHDGSRARCVSLSGKGKEIVQSSSHARQEMEKELLAALDDTEKEQFRDMLKRILNHLNQES
jgi:DNA-binding MarR family transcriptional regulator